VARYNSASGHLDQVGYGVSTGLYAAVPFGLGFHRTADFSMHEQTNWGALLAEKRSPLIAGGGIHYTARVPGLEVV